MKKSKIKSLMVIGRKWFDKVNGNTYHSSEVFKDGKALFKTEMEYGYGDQYLWTAKKELQEKGFIPNDVTDGIRVFCQNNNIEFEYRCFDVLKRDL